MAATRSSIAGTREQFCCPCCGRNLHGLDRANYCPACGQKILRISPPGPLGQLARTFFHALTLGRFQPAEPYTYTPGGTRILIGYGNAMFNLGWRYERGSGAIRNLPEAVRCYTKSAKLGNIDATVRLAADEGAKPVGVIPIES